MAKFADDNHYPEGEWVKATMLESVVGVHHQKNAASQFAKAAQKAQKKGKRYGIKIIEEPENKFDKNALAVIGYAETSRIILGDKTETWHIGYVDRDTALEIREDLSRNGIPFDGLLHYIYEGKGGFLDFKFFILAPPGNSQSVRQRRTRAEQNNVDANKA